MTIAAFDFDGTITKRDTLLGFLMFSIPFPKLLFGFTVLLPTLLLYSLGFISNHTAKEKLFAYFFGGMHASEFENLCINFSGEIQKILREKAINKMCWHQQNNHRVIIVSASIADWIKPWAVKNGNPEVIATEIEVKNGIITGKFLTLNCSGAEKVIRLKKLLPDFDNYEVYAYGNGKGDKELLNSATKAFFRNF